jgi:hypothetical protein
MIICRHVSHSENSMLAQEGDPKHDTFFMNMERDINRPVVNPAERMVLLYLSCCQGEIYQKYSYFSTVLQFPCLANPGNPENSFKTRFVKP